MSRKCLGDVIIIHTGGLDHKTIRLECRELAKKKRGKGRLTKVRKFFNEFKTFAIKGNMIEMAVGIIVGGAFTALITSIVVNIATPLIGILIGVDFTAWSVELPRLYGNAEPSILNIGLFLNSIISFILIAFVVFLFVKALNKFRKKPEDPPPPPPEPTNEELLLAEIRDILKIANGIAEPEEPASDAADRGSSV